MTTWTGKASFDRAPIVLVRPDEPDTFMVLRRYVGDEAEGALASAAEWRALIRSGDAMELGGMPAPMAGSWLWLMRRHWPLDRRATVEELCAEGRLIGDPVAGPGDSSWACLVQETGAEALREDWATEWSRQARDRFARGDWDEAARFAEAAFDVEPVMTSARVALLVAIGRARGDMAGAEAYLALARSAGVRQQAEGMHVRREAEDEGDAGASGDRTPRGTRGAAE
jgi:hypothetical protein